MESRSFSFLLPPPSRPSVYGSDCAVEKQREMGNVSSATRSFERFLLLLLLLLVRKSVSATAGEVNSASPLKRTSERKSGTTIRDGRVWKESFSFFFEYLLVHWSLSLSLSFFSRATFIVVVVVVVVFEANSCAFSLCKANEANWEQNGAA